MNIRTRVGKLETIIGKCLPLRAMSNDELEARIRKAAGLADDVELTDELLQQLSTHANAALMEAHQ